MKTRHRNYSAKKISGRRMVVKRPRHYHYNLRKSSRYNFRNRITIPSRYGFSASEVVERCACKKHIQEMSKRDDMEELFIVNRTANPTKKGRDFVQKFQNKCCNACRRSLLDIRHLDHIVAKRFDKIEVVYNYQYLCVNCHEIKNKFENTIWGRSMIRRRDRQGILRYLRRRMHWDSKLSSKDRQKLLNFIINILINSRGYIEQRRKQMIQYIDEN